MRRRAVALIALLGLFPVGSTVLAKGLGGADRAAVSTAPVMSYPTATTAQAVPGIVAPAPPSAPSGASSAAALDAPDAFVVTTHLRMAGLPVSRVDLLTTDTDPEHLLGQAGQYRSRVLFRDGRLTGAAGGTVDAGGSVEAFQAAADLRGRQAALIPAVGGGGNGKEHDLVAGLVLLRLSSQLTPEQVAAYEQALPAAVKRSSIAGG